MSDLRRIITLTALLAATLSSTRAPHVPYYRGCPIFAAGDWYNRDVTNAHVDGDSANYISDMWNAGNTGTFVEAPEQVVNIADSRTRVLAVRGTVKWHDPAPVPWQPDFAIEPTSDHHALILKPDSCTLYELYGASYDSGTNTLSAYNDVIFDLRRAYPVLALGASSSMASGLSLFAGMVKWNEIQSGRISHALNWAARYNTASEFGVIPPASASDRIPYRGTGAFQMPYGAHLRLKRTYDLTHLSPQGRAVAVALQTYGMYLSDAGYTNKLFFEKPPAGQSYDVSSLLDHLTLRDFDVLSMPHVLHD
jgi:hypothetical protein